MIFKDIEISIITTIFVFISLTSAWTNPKYQTKIKFGSNKNIIAKIDSILNDTTISKCFIGVKIIELKNGNVFFERNSNKLFHPASNLKLLTSAAALNYLNKDFHFTTKVLSNQQISDEIFRGNLYIKGGGDPIFSTDNLDSLVSFIKTKRIKTINGDIIGDVSYFDTVYWGNGWMWDDEPSSSNPFITPLSINGNSVKVSIQSNEEIGDTATVTIEPISSCYQVFNNCIVSNDTLMPDVHINRDRERNKIYINGKITPDSPLKEFTISLWKPEMVFLQMLMDRMILDSIEVIGKIKLGIAVGNISIADISNPIDSVLHRMNKLSDNLAAENLLKTLGAEKYGVPGTAQNGLTVIKEYLASIDIDTAKMILADGSGVSWYNEITPDIIIKVLQHQYQNKATFERFYESLAVAGVDGTLKNRMKNTRSANNIRGKTGSLNGVSGISGYVTTANGKLLAFSILCNHFAGDTKELREAQDNILELLANSNIK